MRQVVLATITVINAIRSVSPETSQNHAIDFDEMSGRRKVALSAARPHGDARHVGERCDGRTAKPRVTLDYDPVLRTNMLLRSTAWVTTLTAFEPPGDACPA